MAWLRGLVGGVVTSMWALSVLADMSRSDYEMSPFVHLALMTVAGGLFGVELVRKRKNGGDI
ncbi:MAG: hypothetical protein M3N32_07800 [Actinomycetota bacterium]|nr:hypothetical protein [Actinomycetota bacterium]